MQIKSWQIVLMGEIFSFAIVIFFWSLQMNIYKDALWVFYFFTGAATFIILFLRDDGKWKKIGASLSIILGIGIFIFMLFAFLILNGAGYTDINDLLFFRAELVSSLFLVAAGIHYFWKKA